MQALVRKRHYTSAVQECQCANASIQAAVRYASTSLQAFIRKQRYTSASTQALAYKRQFTSASMQSASTQVALYKRQYTSTSMQSASTQVAVYKRQYTHTSMQSASTQAPASKAPACKRQHARTSAGGIPASASRSLSTATRARLLSTGASSAPSPSPASVFAAAAFARFRLTPAGGKATTISPSAPRPATSHEGTRVINSVTEEYGRISAWYHNIPCRAYTERCATIASRPPPWQRTPLVQGPHAPSPCTPLHRHTKGMPSCRHFAGTRRVMDVPQSRGMC